MRAVLVAMIGGLALGALGCASNGAPAVPGAVAPPVEVEPAPVSVPLPPPPPGTAITLADATTLLFGAAPSPSTCTTVACLIDARYADDPRARDLAAALYRDAGAVAGVGADEQMDGGYRGTIHLVPELPIGRFRQQLQWVHGALLDIQTFVVRLGAPVDFRWRDLALHFVRSVDKRTPSAYALGFDVTYNVRGSLLASADGVRDTMFHELFHSNDDAHGDWSATALRPDYDAIVARCAPRLERACLAPYAPGTTTVKGGTYYAFQQDNGDPVHEYAAELALRYFNEHRAWLATGTLRKAAFKCGPAENGRAWQALVDEFFAGIDRIPACPSPRAEG